MRAGVIEATDLLAMFRQQHRASLELALGRLDCNQLDAAAVAGESRAHFLEREIRRVLMWQARPGDNGQPADLVLGQTSFDCRDENGGSEPTACSMRWPHAITAWRGKLCVTDAGNNRILVWDGMPVSNNAASDWVLGQKDFRLVDHNQSLYWPGAATLHMPYGVAAAGPWCISADTANSRLIAWHIDDCGSGATARALTGQTNFNAKGDNGWRSPTRESLSWPYGISAHSGIGVIADSGNNRVLIWPLAPELLAP